MKNWLSYKDAISIEESIPQGDNKKTLSAAELPKLGQIAQSKTDGLLPQLKDKED